MNDLNFKSKILVVDDEPRNVKLLEAHLIPRGYDVVAAYSGAEALLKLSQENIDLVLLDVIMPELNGFEVTKKIREDEKSRLIPIILITALRETEERIKGIEAGCDDFISKPFDKNEVLARVKTLLKINFYRQQLDEKEKFSKVIHEISEGIIVCAADWRIKDINVAAKKYLNIDDSQNIYLPDFLFDNFSITTTKDLLYDPSYPHKTFDIVRKETEKTPALYLEANCDILKNPSGETSDIVLTVHDVTDMRKEKYLKQDFLALISHKLRTPISVIWEAASILNDEIPGPLTDKQKDLMSNILKKTDWFRGLVDKLIDFAAAESQSVYASREIVNLKPYLLSTIDSTTEQFKDSKIALNINCPEKEAMLSVRRSHFDLVIKNIIENAIKFNDKKTIKINVEIRVLPDNVEIEISDNGLGIAPEERERVFDVFYQSEKDFTGNVEGVGLGLSLVKRLLEASGASISLDSRLGEGTAVTLTFPKTTNI